LFLLTLHEFGDCVKSAADSVPVGEGTQNTNCLAFYEKKYISRAHPQPFKTERV